MAFERLNMTSTGNGTDIYQTYARIRETIETYVMPISCIFGLIGNTLAAITFLRKPMRNKSCSLYLAVRSLSDNGFLATLLIIWTSGTFRLQLGSILGICQMLVFLTYVCGCISVWLVVFVTAENYIRICHPFVVPRLCTTKTAKILLCGLTVFTLALYNFPLWISKADCTPNSAHYHVTQAFIYTDTLITLIVPVILMAVLMIPIFCSLFRSLSWRRGMTNSSSNSRSQNPITKVTRMLLAVSTIFFLMNLPSHVIRLQILINSFLQGYIDTPAVEAIIQTVALQIYYLSLGINILIYLVFGSQFREVFKKTFMPECAISSMSSKGNINQSVVNTQTYVLLPRNVVSAEVKLGSANSTVTVVHAENQT